MNEEIVKFIIARVIDNAKEHLGDKSDFGKGCNLAYYEILDTIKNELLAHEQDLSEFGLDINLESRFI